MADLLLNGFGVLTLSSHLAQLKISVTWSQVLVIARKRTSKTKRGEGEKEKLVQQFGRVIDHRLTYVMLFMLHLCLDWRIKRKVHPGKLFRKCIKSTLTLVETRELLGMREWRWSPTRVSWSELSAQQWSSHLLVVNSAQVTPIDAAVAWLLLEQILEQEAL